MKTLCALLLLAASAAAQEIPVITAGTGGHSVLLTVANGSPTTTLRNVRVSPDRTPEGARVVPAERLVESLPPGTEIEVPFTLDAGNGVRLGAADTLRFSIRSPGTLPAGRSIPVRFVPPGAFALGEVYPNPFNPTAECELRIAEWANTRVVLYDLLGREVRVIREEVMAPGVYPIGIDGAALASGVYFLRMTATPVDGSGGYTAVRRLALVR